MLCVLCAVVWLLMMTTPMVVDQCSHRWQEWEWQQEGEFLMFSPGDFWGMRRKQRGRNATPQQQPVELSTQKLLYRIYTDVKNPGSFSSPWKLYKAAKKEDSSITLMQVEHFLESQKSYTLHRHFNSRFHQWKVLAHGVRYQFQADLIDYAPLKRENGSMTFLLSVIDMFSWYAMLIPIKNKWGDTVWDALVRVFDHMGTLLKLQTDKGKEFYNRHIWQLLNEKTVHHFLMEQDVKAQIVERFNRTVREVIKCYMTHMSHLQYVDILPNFLARYNNHPHSSIYPYSPAAVTKENERVVHELQYRDYLHGEATTSQVQHWRSGSYHAVSGNVSQVLSGQEFHWGGLYGSWQVVHETPHVQIKGPGRRDDWG